MRIVVNRDKWANPSFNNGDSALLNSRGNMCCLGFALLQCGVPEDGLSDIGTPEGISLSLFYSLDPATQELVTHFARVGEREDGSPDLIDTELSNEAVNINDDGTIDLDEREQRLIELFKKFGHTIEFV